MHAYDPWKRAKRLGYKVVYVKHSSIGKYIACYNVRYGRKVIKPNVADRLGIPLNEVWISDKYKKYSNIILFHELQEIKYRSEGHSGPEAHRRARKDEKLFGMP